MCIHRSSLDLVFTFKSYLTTTVSGGRGLCPPFQHILYELGFKFFFSLITCLSYDPALFCLIRALKKCHHKIKICQFSSFSDLVRKLYSFHCWVSLSHANYWSTRKSCAVQLCLNGRLSMNHKWNMPRGFFCVSAALMGGGDIRRSLEEWRKGREAAFEGEISWNLLLVDLSLLCPHPTMISHCECRR